MRIAQLSSMTGFYGGEAHLAALARGLRDRGHDVHAVVRSGSLLSERLGEDRIPVLTLPLVDWYEPTGTLRLHRWLRRERIDILHTHVPRDWYTAAVATLGTSTAAVGTRHRLEPVGCAPLKRPFLGRFAALLAVSEAVRAPLLAGRFLPPDRVLTVPNGIEVPVAPADRGTARLRLGLAAAGPVVGYVGRLDEDKGTAVLLEATALLRRRRPDLVLALVGEAGGAQALAARAAEPDLAGAVRFCGYRPDAAELCRAFDVQAVPSRAEPFGLVVLEAMAQGVPVVATRAGGVPEIIRDGVDGVLVAPDDTRGLADALEALLADRDRREQLAAAARLRVGAAFGLEAMIDRVEAVYRRALRSRAAGRGAAAISPASPAPPAPRRR